MTTNGSTYQIAEHDLAPGDIARLIQALLDSIDRGEVQASPREVEFLASIEELLAPPDVSVVQPR